MTKSNKKMNKYTNYVFMTICEASLKRFKKSGYSTYTAYCTGLLRSIRVGNLSKSEKFDLIQILQELDLMYGMSEDDNNYYILAYLESGRCGEFQNVVEMTRILFPFTGG
jgi:hypothetical protein